jgi:hypothetical protein
MDFGTLKDAWQEHAREERPAALEANAIMAIITRKADDIRQDVRRRLRRESTYYLPMLAIGVISLFDRVTLVRVGSAVAVSILLGGIAATLWVAQKRITEMPLDGSLREVLRNLHASIDAAARAYLAAYVVTFICSTLLLAVVIWSRSGAGVALVATLAIGTVATWWSYWSGRAYVDRMFRRDRANLSDCLRQLNEQAP